MSDRVAAAEPRVLVLVDRLQVGGPGRLVVALATGLRGRGVDVRVAHLGLGEWEPLAAELAACGVTALNLRLGHLLDPRPEWRLAGYLRRERIDVVHTHNRYAHLVGRTAAMLAGRPVVSTVHYLQEMEPGWREAVRRWLDHMSARMLCSVVITVSEAQRRVYLRAAGIEDARVQLHRNGVDPALFRPDPVARGRQRSALGLPPEAPVLAVVGMFHPDKGIEFLLQALALIRPRAPAARLLVVGDGVERPALEALAHELGLGDVVRFLGVRSDVAALLAASDVYVHPSLSEALPTSVLEAMAVGVPVVATDVGGVSEIVAHGQTGLLVPAGRPDRLAEAMLQLMDPGLRMSMGASGRAWVQTHASTGLWLDGLHALYRAVGRPSGAG